MRSILGIALLVSSLWLQDRSGSRPSFDVVSIKSNTSADGRFRINGQPGGRFVATATVKMLVGTAYGVTDSRLFGGPGWIDSDRFDIEARSQDMGAVPDRERMMAMVRSLLEDRFRLKVHHETRELPVYELTVAKSGLKIKLSPDQSEPLPPPPGELGTGPGRGSLSFNSAGTLNAIAIRLGPFVNSLSQQLGRPVVDKTGLTGLYDFALKWTPDSTQAADAPGPSQNTLAPDSSAPSIFTAIQEQLGLRMASARAPQDVIFIDSVEHPLEN